MAMVIAALYAAHRTALVRMLTAVVGDVETAEDVCQDVFVFALSGDNDPSRGDDPVLWLYYTARQLAQQALYHRQRSRQALLSAYQLVDDPTDRALDTLPGGRCSAWFARALAGRAHPSGARLFTGRCRVCAALHD